MEGKIRQLARKAGSKVPPSPRAPDGYCATCGMPDCKCTSVEEPKLQGPARGPQGRRFMK